MKFNIVVPIYNVEKYLKKCLDSIAAQDYKDYKVLMIDDGSTDTSSEIAKKYAERNNNFFYFYKKNGGLSSARNYGIDHADCDYLLFIDSDDYVVPQMLSILNEKLRKNPVDVIEFNAWIVEEGKDNIPLNRHYVDENIVKSGHVYFADNLRNGCLYSAVWLKCVRFNLFYNGKLRFKDGLLHEDELWTPQLMIMANTIMYIDNKLYFYYQRPGSIMHTEKRQKNYSDAKSVFYELEKIYLTSLLPKKELNIYRSYLSRKMIGICQMDKENVHAHDKIFIKRNAKDLKSRVQMILFMINPKLLKKLIPIIKKAVRYEKEIT